MKPTSFRLLQHPTVPLVSVGDFVEHARLNVANQPNEQAYIAVLLSAAEDSVESVTGRSLLVQRWSAAFCAFPNAGDALLLPRGPLASVEAVKYLDTSGVQQTLAAATYVVEAEGALAPMVRLADGKSWPSTSTGAYTPVTVEYTTGAVASAVAPEMKVAIMQLASHWYENREPVVTGTIATDLPMHVGALLARFRQRLM